MEVCGKLDPHERSGSGIWSTQTVCSSPQYCTKAYLLGDYVFKVWWQQYPLKFMCTSEMHKILRVCMITWSHCNDSECVQVRNFSTRNALQNLSNMAQPISTTALSRWALKTHFPASTNLWTFKWHQKINFSKALTSLVSLLFCVLFLGGGWGVSGEFSKGSSKISQPN